MKNLTFLLVIFTSCIILSSCKSTVHTMNTEKAGVIIVTKPFGGITIYQVEENGNVNFKYGKLPNN